MLVRNIIPRRQAFANIGHRENNQLLYRVWDDMVEKRDQLENILYLIIQLLFAV